MIKKITLCNKCLWGGEGEKQALNQNYFTDKQFLNFLFIQIPRVQMRNKRAF